MSYIYQSRKDYVKQLLRLERDFLDRVNNPHLNSDALILPPPPTMEEIAEAKCEHEMP
jgi:hypothetical protein